MSTPADQEFAALQGLARTCLAANAALAGAAIFLELDPAADATELEAQERAFNAALATQGFALVVGYPVLAGVTAAVAGRFSDGRVAVDAIVPISFCENEAINRGAADPSAVPPLAPLGIIPAQVMLSTLSYLMREFRVPDHPLGKPDFAESFAAHTLLVTRPITVTRAA